MKCLPLSKDVLANNFEKYHNIFLSESLGQSPNHNIAETSALIMLNPLPDDKILDWSVLKKIADNIFKVYLK